MWWRQQWSDESSSNGLHPCQSDSLPYDKQYVQPFQRDDCEGLSGHLEQHNRRDPQRDVRRSSRRPRKHREFLRRDSDSEFRCDGHVSVSLHYSRFEHERNGRRSVRHCGRACEYCSPRFWSMWVPRGLHRTVQRVRTAAYGCPLVRFHEFRPVDPKCGFRQVSNDRRYPPELHLSRR